MTTPAYPFAAIVGQPELKLVLLLASIDWLLSVLLKGDRGSGKSTAARALANILPAGAPFVNLPIGTTEDRLLGGLDLGRALEGEASLKRGLIHEANGGVLYIDEVNLLADSLTDALLDVASSGLHHVERDGFSASAEARFVLLGSMNIEEGALRPQLLDRFALSLDVESPVSIEDRTLIVQARLRFDTNPSAFCAAFEKEQQDLRETLMAARSLILQVNPSLQVLQSIARAVANAGVRSLRADLAALRAAIARAAIKQRSEILQEDIDAVLPLVLHHRSRCNHSQPSSRPPDESKGPNHSRNESENGSVSLKDRIFAPEPREVPELRIHLADSGTRGRSAEAANNAVKKSLLAHPSAKDGALDVVASFTQSFRNTGMASLTSEYLVFRTSHETSGIRFIFVVDSSGSHAAQQRMRAVKGAVAGLLQSSVDRKDEVAVISFRGPRAEIVLQPCRDIEAAHRVLEFLPTGGRTPLAHALELARTLVTPSSLLILLTDGRANVALAGGDPWTEALNSAGRLTCPSILVDSSIDTSTAEGSAALASAMRARTIRLEELWGETLLDVFRK